MFGVQWRVCHNTHECMLVPSMADYGVVQVYTLGQKYTTGVVCNL